MKGRKTRYGRPDAENPDITPDQMGTALPAHKVLPQFFETNGSVKRRGRPAQSSPTKQLVSLRIDRATIDAYRATGRGWQTRIAEDLAKAAKRRTRSKVA